MGSFVQLQPVETETAGAQRVAPQHGVGRQPLDPRRVRCRQETGDAAVAGRRIGLGIDAEQIGMGAAGHPGLLAVDAPAAFGFRRRGPDVGGVAAALGLGQQEGADAPPGDQVGQMGGVMMGFAVARDIARQIVVHDEAEGEGQVGGGQHLHDARHCGEVEARPAQLLGHQQAHQPGFGRRLQHFARRAALPFPCRGMGGDCLGGEAARGFDVMVGFGGGRGGHDRHPLRREETRNKQPNAPRIKTPAERNAEPRPAAGFVPWLTGAA